MRKMSTLAYVKKYKLNENDKFNHGDFVNDFVAEFTRRVIDNNAVRNYYRFERTISEARAKYNAINNKTLGDIGDKLWNFIYAQFIAELRSYLFPSYKAGGKLNIPDGDITNEEFESKVVFMLTVQFTDAE
jgi:hypothetical protein